MVPLNTVDRDLVLAAVSGAPGAADRLLAVVWPAAYRTAVALCGGDVVTAQDALQNACLACFAHLSEVRDPARFVPWFMRILTRAVRTEQKRNARWRSHSERDTGSAAMREDDVSVLNLCIAQLPKALREALILMAVVGYSSAEAAAILGVSAGTVRYRVFEARRRLGTLLADDVERAATKVTTALPEGLARGY